MFGALCLLYTLPLATVKYPPLQDAGAHLQIINLWTNAPTDPGLMGQEYEVRGGLTPYLAYYGTVRLLAMAMPLESANHLFLCLYPLAFALTFLMLLRSFGRSPWLAVLCFPLIYNKPLIWGFIPNVVSYPLFFAAVALLKRYCDRPSIGREIVLAATTLLLYLTHVVGLFAFAVCAPVIFFTHNRKPLQILRRGVFALPTLVLGLFWSKKTLASGGFSATWNSVSDSLQDGFAWLGDAQWAHLDDAVVALCLVAPLPIYMFTPKHDRPRGGQTLGWATLLFFGVFFFVPSIISKPVFHLMTQSRLAVPLAAMWIAALPIQLVRRSWLVLAPTIVAVAALGTSLIISFHGFDEKARPIDAIVEAMEPNRSVLPLYYHTRDGVHHAEPFLHLPDYYQVRKGGYLSTSLIAKEVVPVVQTRKQLPNPGWRRPQAFRYERHGRYYHYFLIVHRGSKRSWPSFRGAGDNVRLVKALGHFALYENTGPLQPSKNGALPETK